jgi:PAS domain S-box-containing protein
MFDIFPNEFGEKLLADDARVMKSGYEKIEECIVQLDGRLHHFETQKFIIPRPGHEPFLAGICLDITDRLRAEEELKESEEKFKTVFHMLPDLLCVADINTATFKLINPEFTKILGYTNEELLNKSFLEFIHSEDIVNTKKVIEKELKTGKLIVHFINRYRCKDGSYRWFDWNSRPIPEKGVIYAVAHDITNLIQTEQSLKESEEKYRTILETTSEGFYFIDTKGKIKDVNLAYCELTGYSKEELLTMSVTDLNIGESKSEFESHIQQIIKQRKGHFETIHKHKDGSLINVEINVTYFSFIESHFVVFIHDITERKRNEEYIHKLTNELQVTLDTVSASITHIKNRKIEWSNSAHDKMFGYSIGESHGVETLIFYKDKKDFESFGQRAYSYMAAGSIFTEEMEMCKKDGTLFWCSLTGQLIYATQPDEGSIWMLQDISERKRAELLLKEKNEEIETQNEEYLQINEELTQTNEELIITKKQIEKNNQELTKLNADKDRFISILAHDLKSPFNSILGFLFLLTENIRKYDIDKIEKQIHIINNSAQNTYKLLEDILIWVKANSGKIPFEPQTLNFANICTDIIENFKLTAKAKNITIKYTENENINIYADINMIHTILRNLISNAIKFTNNGGRINIYGELNNSTVTISVSDNGIGIDSDTLTKLFDISHKITTQGTAKEIGTGLGLLLCKEFIEKHDGKIWVESKVGKGSEFKFTIPLFDCF